ncbi:hypothetical protein D7X25_26810 [bacterium 1XD42-8]|nr:hypothetical protein D7X25_26810 [bacterium 1XD42-8]
MGRLKVGKRMEDKTSLKDNKGKSISENEIKGEAKEKFHKYIELIKEQDEEKKEYIVDGALLRCSCATRGKRKIKVDSTEMLSKPTNVEENSKIYIENRKESINGQTPAGVTDSLGGMRGEEEKGEKGQEGKKERANIVSFGNCTFLPDGEDLDKLLKSQNLMGKKEEIIKAIKEGKGTCYCFMKLNEKWENLYIPESHVEEKRALPKAGVEKVRYSSYMRFNGIKGITLSSTLFCKFGQGIIRASKSGQTGRRVYIPEEIEGKVRGKDKTLKPWENWGVPSQYKEHPKMAVPDADGRYTVSVGPRVIDPNYPDDGKIWKDDFGEYPIIRVVLRHKETGEEKVIECKIDNIKAHSYNTYQDPEKGDENNSAYFDVENGYVQTGILYPNTTGAHTPFAEDNIDSSVIEFSGHNVDFEYKEYELEGVFVIEE